MVALMPESTRAVLVVHLPKADANPGQSFFDESAIGAHMGMAELVEAGGAYDVFSLLYMNNDEDWHAVGVSGPLDQTPGGGAPLLQRIKFTFVMLSKSPLDGAEGDWTRMVAKPQTRQVALVGGIPIYAVKNSPQDAEEQPQAQGCFVALLEHSQ